MSDNVSAFSDRPADPAKTGRLAPKLTNPIEKLAAFLPEVGDPIVNHAHRVEAHLAVLAQTRAQVTRCEHELGKARDVLWARISQHYADSEIETADVNCTRRLFSGTDRGEGV